VVENDTIYFWQFTNVTKQAGITYDELHSDPLFFDADNDGYLDLFITSVYDNERSYLYHNKGDGTFEDITWLSGARVYNGWGNASADLNRDGLIDLVVGSGNGAKILQNKTVTNNNALYVKPVWKNDIVELVTDTNNYDKVPNTPAFGTRVEVTIKRPFHKQKTLIRELCSAKGTGSQNAPELHFGINKGKVVNIRIK
ncbi:MAG TPA: CRTAC1 family protein, partial [Candidatus Cloacimonas sp.]|nr:CRTAC1 family protein [Candidatus Cloacimonas sp.]